MLLGEAEPKMEESNKVGLLAVWTSLCEPPRCSNLVQSTSTEVHWYIPSKLGLVVARSLELLLWSCCLSFDYSNLQSNRAALSFGAAPMHGPDSANGPYRRKV